MNAPSLLRSFHTTYIKGRNFVFYCRLSAQPHFLIGVLRITTPRVFVTHKVILLDLFGIINMYVYSYWNFHFRQKNDTRKCKRAKSMITFNIFHDLRIENHSLNIYSFTTCHSIFFLYVEKNCCWIKLTDTRRFIQVSFNVYNKDVKMQRR